MLPSTIKSTHSRPQKQQQKSTLRHRRIITRHTTQIKHKHHHTNQSNNRTQDRRPIKMQQPTMLKQQNQLLRRHIRTHRQHITKYKHNQPHQLIHQTSAHQQQLRLQINKKITPILIPLRTRLPRQRPLLQTRNQEQHPTTNNTTPHPKMPTTTTATLLTSSQQTNQPISQWPKLPVPLTLRHPPHTQPPPHNIQIQSPTPKPTNDQNHQTYPFSQSKKQTLTPKRPLPQPNLIQHKHQDKQAITITSLLHSTHTRLIKHHPNYMTSPSTTIIPLEIPSSSIQLNQSTNIHNLSNTVHTLRHTTESTEGTDVTIVTASNQSHYARYPTLSAAAE